MSVHVALIPLRPFFLLEDSPLAGPAIHDVALRLLPIESGHLPTVLGDVTILVPRWRGLLAGTAGVLVRLLSEESSCGVGSLCFLRVPPAWLVVFCAEGVSVGDPPLVFAL